MNETEIRERIHGAMGDAPYPPDLTRRVVSRMAAPSRSQTAPLLISVVAALLAVAIVATLVFIRTQSPTWPLPAETPPPSSPSPQAAPVQSVVIPTYDLDQADMSGMGALVTPLNLSSTSGGRTMTLIGAYADSSRTALFFRLMPDDASVPQVMVYDGSGLLNASVTGGRGIIGDKYVVLHTHPRPGSDGVAQMRVVVNRLTPDIPGDWTFEFPLRAQASIHLRPAPPLVTVGSWTFTLEAFEVTPTLVHFQAVIDGAVVADIKQSTFSLTTVDWKSSLPTVSLEATSLGPRSTRVDIEWRRPEKGDTYMFVVNGRDQSIVAIDGTATPAYLKGGPPLLPTDYPAAAEALTFSGAFSATVVRGQPSSCGIGTGSSGTLFGLAIYFQVDQAWYWLDVSTDPRVRQYNGAGTYDVKAQISPKDGSTIFIGTLHLTVTSDSYPGPYRGSVRGTLTWTGAAASPQTVDVAGNWTCKPGGQLGPG